MDPFAPIQQSQGPQTGGPPCPRCGQPMDPSLGSYDAAGNLICNRCSAQQQVAVSNAVIEQRDPGSARNLWGASAASAFLGLTTCCAAGIGTFFFVLCPIAFVIGAGTMIHILRDKTARERLGTGFIGAIALCVVGMAFGALGTLLGVLGVVGSPLQR